MATKVTPLTVTTNAYKQVIDVPIDATIGNQKHGPPDGYEFGTGPAHPLVYPDPEGNDGTWLGDPLHFDRA